MSSGMARQRSFLRYAFRPAIDFHNPGCRFMTQVITLGWRERLAMPSFGIAVLKAKLDTGARSSALHVENLTAQELGSETWLTFVVRTGRRANAPVVACRALATGRRPVIDSGGHATLRWFIRTDIELGGQRFEIDLNLTDRRHMLFPLLLGRTSLEGRVHVDASRSYTTGLRPLPLPVG
jgi:hypothetical protein